MAPNGDGGLPQDPHELVVSVVAANDLSDAGVVSVRELVDACPSGFEVGGALGVAARLNHGFRRQSGLGVPGGDLRVHGQERDARFVGSPGLRVEEIDLAARPQNRRGTGRGATTVRQGRLPRDGKKDDVRFVG